MRILLCVILTAAQFAAAGCSNSKTTEPTPESGTAVLSGKVMADWCHPMNPTPDWPHSYAEQTGRQAILEFFKQGGSQHSTATDMHSEYSIELDTGLYTIVIENWHGWPRRYTNFHVGRDTVFDPMLWLSYVNPDTVTCEFVYWAAGDTLSESQERAQLVDLDMYAASFGAHNAMAIETAVRVVHQHESPFYKYVNYHINLHSGWYVWQVVDAGNATLAVHEDHFDSSLNVAASYIDCADIGRPAPHEMVTIDCSQ